MTARGNARSIGALGGMNVLPGSSFITYLFATDLVRHPLPSPPPAPGQLSRRPLRLSPTPAVLP